MDDIEFRSGQEEQRRAQLLGKLPRQVEGHSPKIRIAQEVIEVVGEQFEH